MRYYGDAPTDNLFVDYGGLIYYLATLDTRGHHGLWQVESLKIIVMERFIEMGEQSFSMIALISFYYYFKITKRGRLNRGFVSCTITGV